RREPVIPRSRVVVIDPGHGGRDPGAIGRRGLQEKDVALDVALKLKRILETKYAVKVYLTREDDRFLELKERTTFANGRGADLFISLHVNASPSRKTRGIETWFLNNPSNEYDQRVAARENAISEEKLRQSQTELGFILTSLERELKRDESIRLANYLQNSLVRNMRSRYSRRIDDHGVKFSLFYVLVGAEMPAALVEVGFITNSGEELMLRKTSYRKDLANSIAKAINSYLSTLPDLPKLARR
ncbi:MAG: N-acetylmuramoyl-L-alanine amidase family protein, partial [Thermodesulfovibrionales bacterium]